MAPFVPPAPPPLFPLPFVTPSPFILLNLDLKGLTLLILFDLNDPD